MPQGRAPVAHKTRFKIPLHVLAAAGSSLVLLTLAALLAWQAYSGTRKILLSSVDESVQHVATMMKTQVKQMLDPAQGQLDLLSHQNLARADSLAKRLAELPTAQSILSANSLLNAVYVGYPNGEFILFRHLRDATVRSVFRAPHEADLLVQTQTLVAGKMQGEYRYYDRRNRLIKQQKRDNYVFDPRPRPWYREALGSKESVIIDPYVFFTTRAVGTTLAKHSSEGPVFGLDVTLRDIDTQLEDLRITANSRVAVVDSRNRLLARDNGESTYSVDQEGVAHLHQVEDIATPAIIAASALSGANVQRAYKKVEGKDWELISAPVPLRAEGKALRVLIAVPHEELFREARHLLRRQLIITLLLLAASIVAGIWVARRITLPLRQLAEDTKRVAGFDFSTREVHSSRITEVDLLATTTQQMKSTIARFLEVSAALNSENRLERLLQEVLNDVAETAQALSGALYLVDEQTQDLKRILRLGENTEALDDIYPQRLTAQTHAQHPGYRVIQARSSVTARANEAAPELVAVPLETLGGTLIGVLTLELPERKLQLGQCDSRLAFVEALASTAAVAIETRHLIEAQKNLLEAMIQLVAGAIDAQSPYTGGHCQRVPELTKLLVRAAHDAQQGPFAQFQLSEEEWEAVHVGAWLHDCGKVTTPEYVVDKATKLETVCNRIHEIRTRFEVLKRDAEINYWRSRSQGTPEQAALAELQAKWQTIDADFAFVAECNVGGEFLGEDKIARLREIAQRAWMRTLDDRLGLSRDELRRLEKVPASALPAVESVLADKPEHLIERMPEEDMHHYAEHGFSVKVPRYKFNRGELYNLSISRGTLTEEERFIINDHIVQTIVMLEHLPFPKHLRQVPEIAGGHHEHMDGRGYPRGLKREEMSVAARVMAIADVFEALTAADRPYKAPKTLSESLLIMANMVRDAHLDADLFELFLRSGVCHIYASRYMMAPQIDDVDVDAFIRLASDHQLDPEARQALIQSICDMAKGSRADA
jgi:HD-GYP domain-containing protein (c-di-GMP phosphodiesterase class II)